MFPGISYQSSSLSLAKGDVIAIVTDGLTEVSDSKQRELGSLYIEDLLRQRGLDPLPAIAHSILEAARQYGKVTDDQTLLLIRLHATTIEQ
jgi:serine phosphatase RsbU (regulator of sigma subunit)